MSIVRNTNNGACIIFKCFLNNISGSDFEKLQALHDSQNKLESEYLVLMEELEGLSEN